MSITTTSLTRSAGLSAVAAGLLFIVIQLVHPHEDVAAVTTTAWIVVALLTMAMSVLLLVGITGMYLRQVTETGLPGLVGFLLFASTFVLTIAVTFVEVFVLPPLADQAPQYVEDFLATFTGGAVVGRRRVPAAGQPGRCGRLPARRSAVRARSVPSPDPRAVGLLAAGRRLRRHAPGSRPPPRPRPAYRLSGRTGSGRSRILAVARAGQRPPSSPRPALHDCRVATRLVSSDAARRRRGAADSAAASAVDLAAARRAGRAQPDPGAGRVRPTRRARGRTGTCCRPGSTPPPCRWSCTSSASSSSPSWAPSSSVAVARCPRSVWHHAAGRCSWLPAWSWRSPRCG